ncbi:MAG: hypothetical protein J6386_09170 [Candidatus Synoicihabitans palmerolidicus]|nr:hypothetical protein [Candidatus Synoicihabitans palmerolidicus]
MRHPKEAEICQVARERFLLLQAVINLVRNVIEFSPRDGTVDVYCGAVEGEWEVAVVDQGPGIPDYAKARVFDRFYSLPRPVSGQKSTGLGLSFVQEIIVRHGGKVGLDNAVKHGARAWLKLPRAR